MTLHIPFDNSYARLDERFYTKMKPSQVARPELIAINDELARDLGIDPAALSSQDGLDVLAGNKVPEGADPLAQVYAGHQFGGWSPRLGDGRAILLGEVVSSSGARFDIQLKGSGPTPYSRMGDGRAWVGPVMREYIVSEAMHNLGVPTTRALAAVTTGETVVREAPYPGAVLTRVASSHIRVGTFQYFASQRDTEALEALTAHAISRHAPGAETALDLLEVVIEKQAALVAKWMGLGFIHGVMNTDNMTISGETIDYGPCAFMDTFHPMRVFSSIDQQGRYAYGRQPDMAMWNLVQLATSLMPLIGRVEDAQAKIDCFPELFRAAWLVEFRNKIGLHSEGDEDASLVHDLLERMKDQNADFTNTFRALGNGKARDAFLDPSAFDEWEVAWRDRLMQESKAPEDLSEELNTTNPALIPRTHRIEQAIQAAIHGDHDLFHRLNKAYLSPYDLQDDALSLTRPPSEEEVVPQTFCGT